MKTLRWTLLTALFFGFSSSQASMDNYESVNCSRGFCVGNEIINPYDGPLLEAIGTIQEIRLKPWSAFGGLSIIIPDAIVKTQSGEIKTFDLRGAVLTSKIAEQNCQQVSDVKFCKDDDVVVIPNYNSGKRDLVPAKVFLVTDILGNGTENESKKVLLSLYQDASGVQKITAGVVGIAKPDFCFGKKAKVCIGQKYDNGLNSYDTVLAYVPWNDEFIFRAGDIDRIMSLESEGIAERMAGKYLKTKTADKTNTEKASAFGSTNIANAKKRVLAVAQSQCQYEFFGQGVLDSQTVNPKISKCSRYIDKGGFSHGIYGPSIQVKCEVDFTYNCIHRLRQR